MNLVMLCGRLGRDPELKQTPSGQPVANFSLAIDESYKDRSGSKVDKVLWVQIVAWGKTGELCAQYLKKGRQAIVTGRLQIRQYDKDGQKRYATEIVANHVEFVGGRPDAASAGSDGQIDRTTAAEPPVDDEDIPF